MNFLKTFFGIDDLRFGTRTFTLVRVSFFVFLGCAVLVAVHRFLESPISCMTSNGLPSAYMDNYCLTMSTFSVRDEQYELPGVDIPYHGVAYRQRSEKKVIFHRYYNFVHILLFCHALLFFFPGYLWANWGEDLLKSATREMCSDLIPGDKCEDALSRLAFYYLKGFRERGKWVRRYLLCEILALLSILLNLFWIDYYLGRGFMGYGHVFLKNVGKEEIFPENIAQVQIFPTVAMCLFYKHGPSGILQKTDMACTLPLNAFHSYVYLFLWFWMLVLIIDGIIIVFTRLLLYPCAFLRMKWMIKFYGQADLQTEAILRTQPFTFGDWLLLHLLSSNLERSEFRVLLQKIAERFDQSEVVKRDP